MTIFMIGLVVLSIIVFGLICAFAFAIIKGILMVIWRLITK